MAICEVNELYCVCVCVCVREREREKVARVLFGAPNMQRIYGLNLA